MKLKTIVLSACLILAGISVAFSQEKSSYALLTASDLQELINNEKNLAIIDLRSEGDYKNSHIPGAINLSRSDFEDKDLDYNGMMSSKEQTQKLLGDAGVTPGAHIVIYDEDTELNAARLWFVLKNYGHDKVQLLDGGFSLWKNQGLEVSDKSMKKEATSYAFPSGTPEYAATKSEVKAGMKSDQIIILDVRSDSEYASGHIPGAVNLDWTNNLDKENVFKVKDDLLKQFAESGITPDKEIVTYCRSGVRASHTAYVLKELLGFKNVKIYDGGWIEWSHFKEEVEK